MQDYRFHGFTPDGAKQFAEALTEDGFIFVEARPSDGRTKGWRVQASGEGKSEGLLEVLATFYGGSYEGDDMAAG